MQVRGRRLTTSDVTCGGLHGGYSWRTTASMSGSASRPDSVFVGVCTPSLCAADVLSTSLLDGGAVAWDTTVFRSQHHVDMKFISVDPKSVTALIRLYI